MRVAAVQSWPQLAKAPTIAPSAAASRSASSKTTNGALPPSSRCTRLTVPAASRMTLVPVRVEPVTEISATSSCRASAPPTSAPGPGITLRTPGGRPASSASRPSMSAVSGVSSDGLRTTVLPAASAGPIFQAAMLSG